MAFRTNSTTRLAATKAVQTFEIFEENDFLKNPNNTIGGGVITVDSGRYIFKDNYTSANRFSFGSGTSLEFLTEASFNAKVTYTGDGTFFTGVSHLGFNLNSMDIVLAGNNNQLFDLTGVVDDETVRFVFMTFTGTGTRTVGRFTFSALGRLVEFTSIGHIDGVTWDNCVFGLVQNCNFLGANTGSNAILNITGSLFFAFVSDTVGVATGPSESVFFIEPTIGTFPTLNIRATINLPGSVGTYFKAGSTGAITAFADASFSAINITGVTVSGPFARFAFSPGPALFANQVLTTANFATGTYNDVGFIDVTGTGFFELRSVATGLPIGFVIDEMNVGDFSGDTATVTSAAHGQGNGQILSIEDTINFNRGYTIYNALTNTFRIDLPSAFPGVETAGTWNTGSLTQTDKKVDVSQSGQQQDSMNVAFGGMNANAGATTIASADTYQAMDFNTMVLDPTTEGWTLIDPLAGIFRYDGLNPVTGSLIASITVVKSGATRIFRFTDSKNGAIPVFATAAYVPIEVKATQVSGTLIRPISVVPGDTIQVMGAEEGNTDAVTVTDFFIQMIF